MTASPMMVLAPSNSRWVSRRLYSGFPRSIGGDVAKVADVPFSGIGCAVVFVFGIEVTTCGCAIGGAAIALFVDVKSVVAFCKPGQVGYNSHLAGFLRKLDRPLGLGCLPWG